MPTADDRTEEAMSTTPQRYRKRPVEIDAIQLTRENIASVEEFMHGKAREANLPGPGRGTHKGLIIHTLEGDMRATWGDWIIRGVKGEFYPCKDTIFRETYDPVDNGRDE